MPVRKTALRGAKRLYRQGYPADAEVKALLERGAELDVDVSYVGRLPV